MFNRLIIDQYMTVWSVVILHFSLFCCFSFLSGSYPVFLLHIFLYFIILIPFYNFLLVVTVHTLLVRTPLLMSTPSRRVMIIITWLYSPIRALASLFGGFVILIFLQGWIVSPAPNPRPGGPGLCIYDPRRQDGPAIPPGTWYLF
jgi:hypothetical protein